MAILPSFFKLTFLCFLISLHFWDFLHIFYILGAIYLSHDTKLTLSWPPPPCDRKLYFFDLPLTYNDISRNHSISHVLSELSNLIPHRQVPGEGPCKTPRSLSSPKAEKYHYYYCYYYYYYYYYYYSGLLGSLWKPQVSIKFQSWDIE